MVPATQSTIRSIPFNPLDAIIHGAGRKLCALELTHLDRIGDPTKSEAQSLVRDLLDISKIVDDALLAIGREAKSHFGNAVDLDLFSDQLRCAVEGNATFTICKAAEEHEADRVYADGWRRNWPHLEAAE